MLASLSVSADIPPYMPIHMYSLRDDGTDMLYVNTHDGTKEYRVDNSFWVKSSFLTIQDM